MAEVLHVTLRDQRGKRRTRRLRESGQTPAVLYGHGEANLSLAVPSAELAAAVRHGSRLVDLKGAVNDKAFIREMQWDTYGVHVLHLDLTRVSEHERVKVQVAVELRGEAPGVKEGGVIDHVIHEVQIECPVTAIPERLQVSISGLNKGSSLSVADIHAPPGVKILTPGDLLVVQCVEPVEEEEEAPLAEAVEPEVIGRKPSEEEGEEEK
jgi:large subunit ribosomal protein L25